MIDITYKENVSVKALKEANANKTTKDLQDKGQALNKAVEENAITHVLIGGANNNIVVNSTTKQVIANTKTPTTLAGNKVIDRIMTFEAKNNNQQLFMLIF
jgi:LysM repeat protein